MDMPLQTTSSTSHSISSLAIDSPSDLSYSSGPSHTSTRNTSPDSASTGILFRRSSPLVSLSTATANIDYSPSTLLDQPIDMDKSAFQSANDRRNKLMSERLPGAQYQHTPQHQQLTPPQLHVIRPNIQQAPPAHHRSLTSANWRTSTADDVTVPQPRLMYNPFDVVGTAHHLQNPPIRTTPFPNTRVDQRHHLQQAASVASYPNLGPLLDAQLDGSFAYCYDRGNGQYTRLIPADMLPPLQSIPAVQQGCAGMIVVPQPRGVPANGHSSNTEPVAVRRSPATPTSPADTIQSRIDNIVAATPPTPVQPSSSSSNNAPPGHRRPKIYCDKWVHEGVCAFTQQGCKYKHEMPSDKVTQHQLGLFHGYPQWWKKHQADLARQREAPPSEGPKNSCQSNDSRTGTDRYLGHPGNSATGGSVSTRAGSSCLPSDAGGQLAWRHSSEYSCDPQTLGPPSSMGRTSASRGIGGALRSPMAANSADNNLSPCPVSYGSPFGPIAPPPRSNAAGTTPAEGGRGSSMGYSAMESHLHDTRRSSPAGAGFATSILPTSNPYASLAALDDSGDQKSGEGAAYTESSRPGGARLL
ncbi:hypothetical protein F4678DRAFT_485587 [Xylaria arbuscula]|nr:hypothetical protein F4678DRAFT_485587 [Xylaria arbuscula]